MVNRKSISIVFSILKIICVGAFLIQVTKSTIAVVHLECVAPIDVITLFWSFIVSSLTAIFTIVDEIWRILRRFED